MEVYILDSLLRPDQVVDDFDSLIWTERFSAYGEFQMTVNSTLANRNRFVEGMNLTMSESLRVMTLTTVEDTTDAEGQAILKLSGPSIEKILDDRIAADLANPKWSFTGLPVAIVEDLFHQVCVLGVVNAYDVIPGIVESGDIFPVDTIDAPADAITYEFEPQSLYAAIKTLCDVYGIGFRMCLNSATNQIYWDVYMGSDRTSHQTTLPPVIFAPDFDNLSNTTEYRSTAIYKNCAFVISPVGYAFVYPQDIDPTVTGFERHTILVKADDITDTDPTDATNKMIQRGKEELAKNPKVRAFDGEINQNSQFTYGVDYNLGDLVEQQNVDGVSNNMQVTEQIFVSDKEGERSYPTLSLSKFIIPGSWAGWPADQVWFDLDTGAGLTEYWADQP